MLSQIAFNPILSVTPPLKKEKNQLCSLLCNINCRSGRTNSMASNHRTNNYLRHLESMKILPSGAGRIPHLNAVILGESLATEEEEFVLPSEEFASKALVQSPEQVLFFKSFY